MLKICNKYINITRDYLKCKHDCWFRQRAQSLSKKVQDPDFPVLEKLNQSITYCIVRYVFLTNTFLYIKQDKIGNLESDIY